MKLQPLRYLCEVVDSGLSVTRAAQKLHTSASGVSKQLRLLEQEVGVSMLHRKNTRITGLTEAGAAALPTVRQILKDVERVRRVGDQLSGRWSGQLTIASTHNHARYALVDVIKKFARRYPHVEVQLRQGTPAQISQWVISGEADFAIGTASVGFDSALTKIPCYKLRHCVVVPRGHALLSVQRMTLEAISRYPLILNHPDSRVGRLVEEAFSAKGVRLTVAVRAMDSSVIKKYVAEGLGIAVLPDFTVSLREDVGLRAIPASHLFRPSTACIMVAREQPLRDHAAEFIRMVANVKQPARKGTR